MQATQTDKLASPACADAGRVHRDFQAGVTALLNRSKNLLLIGAMLDKPENVKFAQGSINSLKALQDDGGAGWAAKDASMGGYLPAAYLQAAWAGLPERLEYLTCPEVQEFLRSHGLQVPFDEVTHSKLDAALPLKDAPVAVAHLDNEHDAVRAELGDGSGKHEQSFVEVVGAGVRRTGIVTSVGVMPHQVQA